MSVSNYCFEGCWSLREIALTESLTELGKGWFKDCISICDPVQLPESLVKIGACAFEGCLGMTSVAIGMAVMVFGHNAFRNFDSLESVKYEGYFEVTEPLFEGCGNLTNVTVLPHYWFDYFGGKPTSGREKVCNRSGLYYKTQFFLRNEGVFQVSGISQGAEMPEFSEEFIVAVDVATENLLGDLCDKYEGKIDLCIDHHPTNSQYAKYLLLDANAAAACEIILDVIKALGVEIDNKTADCLFTGLTTDTGCFRYSSTRANTYRAAAELVELGADNGRINRIMFETKTKTYAAIERLAIEGMQFFCDDRVCIITITQDMYKQTGATESDTEAIAPLTRQIEGIEIGLTIREKPNGECKCSIRTFESVDASSFAAAFGGGGHKQASACRFECSVEEAKKRLISKCEEFLK